MIQVGRELSPAALGMAVRGEPALGHKPRRAGPVSCLLGGGMDKGEISSPTPLSLTT